MSVDTLVHSQGRIPDFSNGNDHGAFEAGIERLLDDLKAEAARDTDRNRG